MFKKVRHSKLVRERIRMAWLLLLPMLVVLGLVAVLPLYRNFFFSFMDVGLDTLSEWKFIGFNNYVEFFEGDTYGVLLEPLWWKAVYNTIFFAGISVPLETIFGVLIALMLNANFVGKGLLRAAILVPWAIPTIVSAKMWSWMLNDQFGIVNDFLMKISILSEPVAWTASSDTAMMAIIFVDVWKTTPFMTLLILAGMQTLPKDCFNVARVDGVHPVKLFFKFTLPMLRNTIVVAIVFRSLDALRIFDLIYVLTPSNEATISMSVFARQYLFEFDKFGYGSAASSILFLVIGLLTLLTIKIGKLNLGD